MKEFSSILSFTWWSNIASKTHNAALCMMQCKHYICNSRCNIISTMQCSAGEMPYANNVKDSALRCFKLWARTQCLQCYNIWLWSFLQALESAVQDLGGDRESGVNYAAEDLFEDVDNLSDSDPDIDTLSIKSTPKPKLRWCYVFILFDNCLNAVLYPSHIYHQYHHHLYNSSS